ncbi:MAG TPA: IS6 family transposase [Candidatus Caenarcaniphilales bacterium]
MSKSCLFKWRHFVPSIILRCVRWYCRYSLSYRDVEELSAERGLSVDHSTVYRWVQTYAAQLDKRCRRHLRPPSDSWRVDEVYVKVKGQGRWLYRAIDKQGDTLDFLLTAKRDATAAKRFFRKTLDARNSTTPRVVNADKHAAYPPAVAALQEDKMLPPSTELRQNKYLNNVIEQDHRFLQRLIKPGLGFKSFNTARRTTKGYEVMHMLRKGQVVGVAKGEVQAQLNFMAQVLGVAA